MTPYSNVIERFLRKIKENKEFFLYNISDEKERLQLIEERSLGLLNDAIAEFQNKISKEQDVDFTNKDDDKKCFNFDITEEEEDILSDMMVVKFFDEGTLRYTCMEKYLGADVNQFSPSTDRKTYQELVDFKHKKVSNKIKKYNLIDRISGEYLV